jgi:hypothetical protein
MIKCEKCNYYMPTTHNDYCGTFDDLKTKLEIKEFIREFFPKYDIEKLGCPLKDCHEK